MAKTPITWTPGKDNMGGYKPFALWFAANEYSAVPTLPETPATDDEYVTAAGAFVPKTVGDTPQYIECTPKTVKYGAEPQGEIEGQSFKPTGEFFRAGTQKAVDAFARKVNNTPGYLVIEDMDGNQIMVGQPGLPCYIKPAYEGGQQPSDRRGFKFTFETDSKCPKVYLGTPIDIDVLL